ncbi:amidase family protein [Mariniplasma anaerobium]|uniref:Amidase n=1 Tax=Mariniplasma anaerobium TaxID=2735436 RepID=A0A7U9XUJ6_9MOLU|nr:amidase family protein [Mariniplasma anaerobium]BCR35855.1 amidase [Mariniplasma anaerobium]
MKDYTVKTLIEKINAKELSIHEISNYYLNRIKIYDGYLNSISEINPDINQIIDELEQKKQKSKLHGIPIVIKDNIQTKDHMHTTANSYALKDFLAPFDATIVKKLRDAGMLLLGKTNLSEFAYFMSNDDMPSGYGSLHGQVKHPYDEKINPLGSSTGSAVSVAADLIPISIGTETNGSLMAPAYKNSITSIKPSLGFVSRYGIIPISQFQDTPGPMAKTVEDCALLLDVIYGYDSQDQATEICKSYKPSFYEATKKSIKDKKIAVLNYIYKDFTYSKEEQDILNEAKALLTSLGAKVIELDFELDDLNNEETLLIEFKHDINNYFSSLKESCSINSLEDLISFNNKHAKRCLVHGQSIFEAAQKTSGDLNDSYYKAIKAEQMKKAKKLENMLIAHQIDAAVSTMRNSYAPIYGNPTISVPAKALNDLNPISLVFFGKKYDDETLITITHQYEKHTHYRIPPKLKG